MDLLINKTVKQPKKYSGNNFNDKIQSDEEEMHVEENHLKRKRERINYNENEISEISSSHVVTKGNRIKIKKMSLISG